MTWGEIAKRTSIFVNIYVIFILEYIRHTIRFNLRSILWLSNFEKLVKQDQWHSGQVLNDYNHINSCSYENDYNHKNGIVVKHIIIS